MVFHDVFTDTGNWTAKRRSADSLSSMKGYACRTADPGGLFDSLKILIPRPQYII